MFTDEQRTVVQNVLEKKQKDPLYRPSPEEDNVIDNVLQEPYKKSQSVRDVNALHPRKPLRNNMP